MIKIVESECDCPKCSSMCRAPCCGTPEEVEKLIELGYGPRLMLDDDPNDVNPEILIKPALKGHEGKRAPYEIISDKGCTFWNKGKCDLHSLRLKPFSGRYAHHDASRDHWEAVCMELKKSWRTKKAALVIQKFKELMEIPERGDK